jgi:hypothetical protein
MIVFEEAPEKDILGLSVPFPAHVAGEKYVNG